MRPRLLTSLAPIALVLLAGLNPARAEELLNERTPFDRITLSQASGGGSIDVLPLNLPVREMPASQPEGLLKVRLVENPSTPYEVNWADIQSIEFYEQLLLGEGLRLMEAGELPAAFDYLNILAREYRALSGVDKFERNFLQKSAAAAFRTGQTDRALAILGGLYERDPRFAGLDRGLEAVGEKRMQELVKNRDLGGARAFLDQMVKQFAGLELPFATRWRQKFETAAKAKLAEGEQLLNSGDYQAARRAVAQARNIWPTSPEANQLFERIARLYPIAVVGVLELADPQVTPRMDTPVARRIAAATATPLLELRDYRAEGGEYFSPWGKLSFELAKRQLALELDLERLPPQNRLTAPYQIAQWALEAADPAGSHFDPALAEVLESVRVERPARVVFQLRRSHTRPTALLLGRPWDLGGEQGAYELTSSAPDQAQLRPRRPAQQALPLTEVVFADDGALIAGLVRGEIDIVANAPPWRWTELADRDDIRLGQYRMPRLHVLMVNHQTPSLAVREFRRALCYGIDREQIVREVLLAGAKVPGFAVLSGPLPIGEDLSDSLGYAYNDQLAPRPYDPRLAAILVTTAWTAVAQQATQPPAGQPATPGEVDHEQLAMDAQSLAEKSPPLRLAHAADPLARLACQTIVHQLEIIGVKVELVELTERDLVSSADKWDLRYAELTMQEPLIDARKLLGSGGLAGACSDTMDNALRQVDSAQNPREVTAALAAVHKACTTDLPVIPLWQTVDRFAYRADLLGLPPSVIELYQTATKWRRQTEGSE
jgi:tetratricopeptide (TPR) repeat protein